MKTVLFLSLVVFIIKKKKKDFLLFSSLNMFSGVFSKLSVPGPCFKLLWAGSGYVFLLLFSALCIYAYVYM